MKKEIHPNYVACEVTCACGNSFTIETLESNMRVDTCDKCHPFFTGTERNINRGGRVDKFKKRYGSK
jgi:large subunit ribosomal protein L31